MKLLHQLYARFFGYFWLPCPKCGAMFGGHQVVPGGAHVVVRERDGLHCYCGCPACDTDELRAENAREQQEQMRAWMNAMIKSGDLQITRKV